MNKIKNTSKLIIGFILGAIIFGGLTGMLAYAINATDVSFTPSDNSWEVENVKAALDDLYTTAKIYAEGGPTLESKILADNRVYSSRTTFGTELSGVDTTGTLYYTNNTDDNSTVFYYAGATTNNWVRFGNDGNRTCYYWRIIRTNTASEGGGVRLLYSGESTDCTGSVPVMTDSYINKTLYPYATSDGQYNNSSYVGYMYDLNSQFGHGTSSYAKQMVDSWYTTKGLSNYATYINEDAVYCSDRSTTNGQTWSATGDIFNYDTTYRAGRTWNGSWSDFFDATPTLKCTNSEDKFSKGTNAGGNGYLSNPIAMMTSDEVIYAGGRIHSNTYNWYYYASDNTSSAVGGKWWWTMSPILWDGSGAGAFFVYGSSRPGFLDSNGVHGVFGLRPVVSLKSSVKWKSGNGTASSPYTIKEA